jgi:1-aminocyclopropane-1-carboxylate deaminase
LRATKLKLSAVRKEQMLINIENIHIQSVKTLSSNDVRTDILRLDLIHPVISGNKWFKIQHYLKEAIALKSTRLVSFGGAYSNHIVALALAGQQAGIPTIGFIRGDIQTDLSPTMQEAMSYGMELRFVSRAEYRLKDQIQASHHQSGWYWIPEGGYGILGAKGAADILRIYDTSSYSHIICATGTGTMMAGLIQGAYLPQQILGISVLKNHHSITQEIQTLLQEQENGLPTFQCIHGYHWGGYAKYQPDLLSFMQDLWHKEHIPTDFVYTAKMIYAIKDLIQKHHFAPGSSLLLIHSGGLQGNRSLHPQILPF